MEEIVIELKNVTKKYKLYKNNNKKLLSLFFKNKKLYKEKVAISNLSFSINKGETVAILGENGAGKSTVIKLLSEISYPTSGDIMIKGKRATLLGTEIGLDLNFTGRENIYLKCTLLGMQNKKIKEIEQEIIDFAEINEYIDQPMKLYSSGMRARLGFAISIQVKPDILIIDETLSVGDEKFKNKCVQKIKDIIKNENVTLVFVTHSLAIVDEFCERGIVLKKGKKIFDGAINEAVKVYRESLK